MTPAATAAAAAAAAPSRPSSAVGSVYKFAQDDAAAFAPFITAAGEQLQLNVITPSSTAVAPDSDGEADSWAASAAAPTIDRIYEYGSHFKLDEPFTIRLRKGETLLLPLEPIHDLLFPSSIASVEGTASPLAIGLELSNCQGTVQSFIQLKNHDRAHRFSTASYQCMTVTQANEAEQQRVNLCPHYDPAFPVAMRMDPSEVKGFILRADIDEAVESIALLRSTKSSGGFEKSFLVAESDDDKPTQSPFNVSFTYEATTLGFESPSIWEHLAVSSSTSISSSVSSELSACDACEYFLYAEKIASNQTNTTTTTALSSDTLTRSSSQLALPYCIRQRASVQYQLPKHIPSTNDSMATSTKVHHHVKLDDLFADHFRSSGEYRFVLMASLPSSADHHHAAMLAYAPQHLFVTVPPFYQSHFFVAFVAVALLAIAAIIQVQYQPYRRFFPKFKPSASDLEDEAEFVSLLARAAKSTGSSSSPRGDTMDSLEGGLLDGGDYDEDEELTVGGVRERSSLLEAIKRTKEQQLPALQLDGYREIH